MVRAIMHGCNGKMGQTITGICKEDTGIEYINIGLYAKEAQEIIYQFLTFNSDEVVDKDYYEVLLRFREEYLNSKKSNVQIKN